MKKQLSEIMYLAFTYDDPDGDGLQNTIGLSCTHLNTLEAVYLGLFPELSNTERGWMWEDEQWIPVYMSKKTPEALEKVRQLYREGLLDRYFAYNSTAEGLDGFISGKTGVLATQYYGVVQEMRKRGFSDETIQQMVYILPTWPAPDGNRYRFTTSLHWSESYFSANVSDEKMNKLLEIYDWMLSDEFDVIRSYGVPDVDYEVREGVVQPKGSDAYPYGKYPSLQVLGVLVQWDQDKDYEQSEGNYANFGESNVKTAVAYRQWALDNTQRVNYNYSIIFMSTPAKKQPCVGERHSRGDDKSHFGGGVCRNRMAEISGAAESCHTADTGYFRGEYTSAGFGIDPVKSRSFQNIFLFSKTGAVFRCGNGAPVHFLTNCPKY